MKAHITIDGRPLCAHCRTEEGAAERRRVELRPTAGKLKCEYGDAIDGFLAAKAWKRTFPIQTVALVLAPCPEDHG